MRGDLIEVYKWVKGFNKGDKDKVFIVSGPDRMQRKGYKLKVFRFKKERGKSTFRNMVVDKLNRFSSHAVSAKYIDCLENSWMNS